MTKWFLPPLEAEHQVGQPNPHAEWIAFGKLDTLSDAIMTAGTVRRERIKSAPQVWGHVCIFESALLNEKHVAHKSAVEEWRGLLTAVALRNTNGRRLTAVDIQLNSDASQTGDSTTRFLRAVESHKPSTTLAGSSQWDRVCLLRAWTRGEQDGVTIGMLSPTTFFVPSRSFRGNPELPQFWLRRGITDPLQQSDEPLTKDEKAVCLKYAQHLQETVRQQQDQDIANRLAGLLGDYISALSMGEQGPAIAAPREVLNQPLVTGLPAGSVLAALNRGWEIGVPLHSVSDTRIKLDGFSQLSRVFTAAVLLDSGIATTLNRRADEVSVLNGQMLSQMIDDTSIADFKKSARQIPWQNRGQKSASDEGSAAKVSGVLVLTPQDIFSDHFVPLYSARNLNEGAPTSISAHPQGCQSYVLPLKPVALLFGGAKFFRDRLNIIADPQGRSYKVQLKLDLIDRNTDTVVSHTIERSYHVPGGGAPVGKDGIVVANPNGANAYPTRNLQAWPNFAAAGWKWNYLLSRGHSEDQVRVTSGASGEIIAHDLLQQPTADMRWQRLEMWGSPRGAWPAESTVTGSPQDNSAKSWMDTIDLRRPSQNGVEMDVERHQRCDFAFEVACLSVAGRHYHPTLPPELYAGIAFFPDPEPVNAIEQEARLAVDFGTTNTTIYWRLKQTEPRAIEFTPRIRRLNEAENREEVSSPTAFFPIGSTVTQPFPSVVQDTNLRLPGTDRRSLFEPWDGQPPVPWAEYAYLRDNVRALIHAIFNPDTEGQPHFGLKWSATQNTSRLVQSFLGHLFLLCSAEMVRLGVRPENVQWWFSYPMALQNPDSYKAMLTGALKRIVPDARPPQFATESEAALGYFLLNQQPDAGIDNRLGVFRGIVLDIGGGTTDIFVYGQARIWRQSFKFAGTQLMVDWLLSNPDALNQLNMTRGTNSVFDPEDRVTFFDHLKNVGAAAPGGAKAAGAIVNTRTFATRFNETYHGVVDDPAFRRLRAGAALMLGGLLYYVSLQLKALNAEAVQNNRPRFDFRNLYMPSICFAGRGASFFSSQRGDELFKRVARACLVTDPAGESAEDGRPSFSNFDFSNDPKSEAVMGMLLMDGRLPREATINESLCAGVEFEITTGAIDEETRSEKQEIIKETDFIDRIGQNQLKRVNAINFASYDRFLALLKTAGLEINPSDEIRRQLEAEAMQEIIHAVHGSSDRVERANPPFIQLVVSTLKYLYRDQIPFRIV